MLMQGFSGANDKEKLKLEDGGSAGPVLRGAVGVFPLFEEGADVSEANAGGVADLPTVFHAGLDCERLPTPPTRSPWLACPPPLQRGGNRRCNIGPAPGGCGV